MSKNLWEMNPSDWDPYLIFYKKLLRTLKDVPSNMNPHVWNEIWISSREAEAQIQKTIEHLQMLARMKHGGKIT